MQRCSLNYRSCDKAPGPRARCNYYHEMAGRHALVQSPTSTPSASDIEARYVHDKEDSKRSFAEFETAVARLREQHKEEVKCA